jgi:transcriptional regulator with XRE-family HTH domain
MDKNIDTAIGIVIRRLRDEKKISQEQLSFSADLHRTYISLLERNRKSVTVKTLHKITIALGIEIDDFLKIVKDELKNFPAQ